MILAPILLALAAHHSPSLSPAPAPIAVENEVRTKFLELAQKRDRDGCLALWKEHASEILATIDADLEGSMRAREKSKDAPDTKKINEMQLRALWGAGIAHETGHPMILDYASAFVGWDEAQRKRFREGQAAFGRAKNALKQNDAKGALAAGQECLDRAAPLGDWWGAAMGWDAIAASQKALGENERALEAAANANAIYIGIALESDEYGTLGMMAELCDVLGRPARGKSCCDRGIEIAKRIGEAEGEKRLATLRDGFVKKLVMGLGNTPAK